LSDLDANNGPASPGQAWARRRWRALAAAGVAAAAAVITAVWVQGSWAAVHQPVTWGCCGQSPTGVGIRAVNTFANYREDIYLPPQRKPFTLFATIRNAGSRSIRIEKVMIGHGYGVPRLAGPVRYAKRFIGRSPEAQRRLPVLRDVPLGPGGELFLAISLRTWPCAMTRGWMIDPSFYLKERSALFTHTVAVPWSMNGGALIMRPSGGPPGAAGVFCAPS
jgi:hypothetical protein